jgi:hypothetical protein
MSPLKGVRVGIEQLWKAELRERLGPNFKCPRRPLLHKYDLPVLVSQGDKVPVIFKVEEILARAFWLLPLRQLVETVEMHLERLPGSIVALEQLHIGVTRQRRAASGTSRAR